MFIVHNRSKFLRSLYCRRALQRKMNFVLPKDTDEGAELNTSFNSTRLKINYYLKKSVLNKNIAAEMPVTPAKGSPLLHCLDDGIINQSQNILKKQFPNTGGWQDPLLSQTSFSTAADESLQIHHTGKKSLGVPYIDRRTFAGVRQFVF